MLGKILLLALAVWLILALLRQYRRSMDSTQAAKSEPEDMVRCAHCGIHLPKAESILKNGAYYCCEDHSASSGQ